MNILHEILSSQNGQVLQQLSRQFGLGESDATNAVASLIPALSQGLRRNMGDSQGLNDLIGALAKGQHSRYMEQPETLGESASLDDGNRILGHIFGSKDVSRQVATQAASTTGLDSGILKKMLPVLAGLAMGALGKKVGGSNVAAQTQATQQGDALGGLASFLDLDGDGSVADDILNFARKLF